MQRKLQECLEKAVKDGTAPHWAGCVVTKDGISPLAYAGISNVKEEQALRDDALYWLASASKLCIALAILHAIEAGKVKGMTWPEGFDDADALTAILPELKVGSDHWFMHIFEGWQDDGKPKLRKAKKAVTLRHLLTWTCGSRGQLFDKDMTRLRAPTESGEAPLRDVMTGHKSTLCEPRFAEADEGFGYGSSANDFCGVFLSRATGMTQREAIQEFICKPLGISEDDMNHYLSPARRVRKLDIYANLPDAGWTPIPLEPGPAVWAEGPPADHHEFGNAGIFATIPAYAKVLQAVLDRNEKILSKEHWEYAVADDLVRRGSKVKLPETLWTNEATPHATATVKLSNPDVGTTLIQSTVERHPTKEGAQPGTNSWHGLSNITWWVDHKSGLAGVVGTQTVPFWNDDAVKTFHDFKRTAYEQHKSQ